jgi:hypothetical protein
MRVEELAASEYKISCPCPVVYATSANTRARSRSTNPIGYSAWRCRRAPALSSWPSQPDHARQAYAGTTYGQKCPIPDASTV